MILHTPSDPHMTATQMSGIVLRVAAKGSSYCALVTSLLERAAMMSGFSGSC